MSQKKPLRMKLPEEQARFCVPTFPLGKASLDNIQESTEDKE